MTLLERIEDFEERIKDAEKEVISLATGHFAQEAAIKMLAQFLYDVFDERYEQAAVAAINSQKGRWPDAEQQAGVISDLRDLLLDGLSLDE